MNTSTVFETIRTIPEKCRMCFTCVRECPAKAIRIIDGQARVVHERCIGCGNCVRVCSQSAKQSVSSIAAVEELLKCPGPVAAMVAPSYPAEFDDAAVRSLPGMLRRLGFEYVNEVGFGADLVARKYREALAGGAHGIIATTCPAVVLYIEKYAPQLIGSLAGIVSPMVATARMLKQLHGADVKTVFIGPCTAKKHEGMDEDLQREVNNVLTFIELADMLRSAGIEPGGEDTSFDPPLGRMGALFPLCGGMLQAADIPEDLLEGQVVSAEGHQFTTALKEFEHGEIDAGLLELLACDGCIMGAGTKSDAPVFRRRARVSRHVREIISRRPVEEWEAAMKLYSGLDLSRSYRNRDQRIDAPESEKIDHILRRMGKNSVEDELNCGACGYSSCREHAAAIHKGLAESEMCLPYTIDRLNETVRELADSNRELASTQEALMQSERLASMGQLAAGIAHEVNNPLGVVILYAHLLLEGLAEDSRLREDASMIAEQADRCKKIVSGLLHFARQNKVLREPVDMRQIVARSIRAVVRPRNIKVEVDDRMEEPVAEVDADQLIQVLTNLFSNAYAAMPDGGVLGVEMTDSADRVVMKIRDTGTGIPAANLPKIFEPFFTTKQIGKGTGLGLAVAYGVIKMHCGDIRVESNADRAAGPTGTTFIIELPRKEQQQ
jgi:signal transduction histidine kinase/iron only hydrogenase large subunit-like protein